MRDVATRDLDAGGVPARLYAPSADGPLPLIVYAHGGGWCAGDLRSHEGWCRRLAHEGRQAVLALHYRLAPEHPYPAGLGDVVAALLWAREHAAELGADPARIAIGGDSAGGNLSAAACLVLRDRDLPQPAFQLLVYPGCDLRRCTESYRTLGQGFLLTRDSIDWYLGHYGADPQDPRASVVLEPDLRGLAPAIVATAGFDPLRDEGETYARRLAEAGVRVDARSFPSLVHGFLALDGVVPAADHAVSALASACGSAWYEEALEE
jgi:acetyl esterase